MTGKNKDSNDSSFNKSLRQIDNAIKSITQLAQFVGKNTLFVIDFSKKIDSMRSSANLDAFDAQKWDFVAKQSGVSTEAIGDAIRLSGGSENFERTVVALHEITDPYKRIAEAQKVFGEQTKALLPLINREKGYLIEMNGEFDAHNFFIEDDILQKIGKISDSFNMLKLEFMEGFSMLLASFMPNITSFINMLTTHKDDIIANLKLIMNILNGIVWTLGPIFIVIGKFINIIINLKNLIIDGFSAAFNFIRDSWSSLCEGLTSGILKAVEVIVSVLNPVLGIINTIVSTVNTITGNGGGGIASVVKNTVSNINQGNTFNNNSSRSVTTTNNNRTVNFYGNIGSQTGNRLLDDLLKTSGNVAL